MATHWIYDENSLLLKLSDGLSAVGMEVEIVKFVVRGSAQLTVPPDQQE